MTRPLRFCFLTTFYPPHHFGGDAIGVQRLARALVRRGHHVTVVHDVDAFAALAPAGADTGGGAAADGVEVVPLRSTLGALSPLLTQQTGRPLVHGRRIQRVLEDGAFDVVAFNNISLVGGPGLLSYGGDALRVYLAHEHWLVCESHVLWRHNRERCTGRECGRCVLAYRRPPQLWRYTGYLARQLRHVDRFIAMSEFSRAKHREFGFPRDMEVLPQFLPDADRAAASPGPRPHERPYFLFAGRLERIKGLDDVVPAFASYEDADLVIAGDGTHGDALRRLAAGNPRVDFGGRLQPDELRRYYQHAVALIAPSVGFETFGLTLIEAFSQQVPVLARRVGPFPEIIESSGGGELFETQAELLAAMRRLQQGTGYRDALARAAGEAFTARWSERVVVPQFLDIIGRALEARRAVVPTSAEYTHAGRTHLSLH